MDKHANNDLEPVRRMRCAAAVALAAFSACAAEPRNSPTTTKNAATANNAQSKMVRST